MIHTYFPASQSCFRFSFSLPLKLTWQGCTLPLTNHLFFGSLWDPTSPRIFSAPFAMPIIKSPDESTLLLRIEVGGFLSLVAKATQRSAALQKGYFAPSVSLIPESDKIHGYPWQERQTWRKSASLELLTPIISIWFNLIWSNLTTFIFFWFSFSTLARRGSSIARSRSNRIAGADLARARGGGSPISTPVDSCGTLW